MAKIITFGKPFISKKGNKVRYVYENNIRVAVQFWTGADMRAWRRAKNDYRRKKNRKLWDKAYQRGMSFGVDYGYNDAKGLR